MITLVLLIVAAVFFGIASFRVSAPIHLGWAGLFVLTLAFLIERGT